MDWRIKSEFNLCLNTVIPSISLVVERNSAEDDRSFAKLDLEYETEWDSHAMGPV